MIAATPQEGFELVIMLSRCGVKSPSPFPKGVF
ncbi:MAG: hypothetical protein KA295_05285 [Giesbergeria sp.]|nr:hypothetical protein [Giesbergeria sp.]